LATFTAGSAWYGFGMSSTNTVDLAEQIIGTLRAHEAELRQAGISHLSLFGSFARGDAAATSDIDLAAQFYPAARMDLFRLTALERRLGEILGRRVDLLPDPPEKQRLRASIDRDRRRAF
jgi:predicted nucleotidyltransferase